MRSPTFIPIRCIRGGPSFHSHIPALNLSSLSLGSSILLASKEEPGYPPPIPTSSSSSLHSAEIFAQSAEEEDRLSVKERVMDHVSQRQFEHPFCFS